MASAADRGLPRLNPEPDLVQFDAEFARERRAQRRSECPCGARLIESAELQLKYVGADLVAEQEVLLDRERLRRTGTFPVIVGFCVTEWPVLGEGWTSRHTFRLRASTMKAYRIAVALFAARAGVKYQTVRARAGSPEFRNPQRMPACPSRGDNGRLRRHIGDDVRLGMRRLPFRCEAGWS